MTAAKKKVDFTSGRILPKIIAFALPIILTNLLQMLYNAADLMVISLSDEPNGVGAVGMSSSTVNLIVNIFIGFSVGSNVVIARHIGAKDKDAAQRATHTALLLALIFGVFAGALGILTARPLLKLLGTPDPIMDLAVTYITVYCLGVPFVSITNFLVSIFRAKGDSKTPLIILSISGLINVALNLLFVLAFGLSAEGVALATAIANIVSSVILLIKLMKSDEYTAFKFKSLKLDKRSVREILYIGFPSAIQGSLISITNMVIASSIATLDKMLTPDPALTPVLNGNAAQGNLDSFVFVGMDAITVSIISFTGQNMGANKPERIKKSLHIGILLTSVVGICMALTVYLLRTPLLSLYGIVNGAPGSADALAFNIAQTRIYFVTLPYFLCGIMNVCTGTLRGMGKALSSFIITLFGLGILRILWTALIFPLNMTIENLLIGYPLTWIPSAIVAYIIARIFIRRKLKVTKEINI